ncbi:hypothetical protein [Endozoicomonas atrinae]|uniref:hypothetical protein n=1 Tax=Endozoicomonas atrinae TaxID=1333660 RepID=UPI003B007351
MIPTLVSGQTTAIIAAQTQVMKMVIIHIMINPDSQAITIKNITMVPDLATAIAMAIVHMLATIQTMAKIPGLIQRAG